MVKRKGAPSEGLTKAAAAAPTATAERLVQLVSQKINNSTYMGTMQSAAGVNLCESQVLSAADNDRSRSHVYEAAHNSNDVAAAEGGLNTSVRLPMFPITTSNRLSTSESTLAVVSSTGKYGGHGGGVACNDRSSTLPAVGLDATNGQSVSGAAEVLTSPSYVSTNNVNNGCFPCATVSDYLVQQVRDVVGPMRHPNSADNYDRHVLLVEDLLQGGASLGFTPSMVLAGVADMIGVCAEAVMSGSLLRPAASSRLGGTTRSKSARSPPRSAASHAARGVLSPAGWAGIPMEAFLPPLVQRSTQGNEAQPVLTVPCEAANQTNCSVNDTSRLPSRGKQSSPLSNRSPKKSSAVQSEAPKFIVDATIACDADCVDLEMPMETLPDALLALLDHCAKPLICLTLDDQRRTPRAVVTLATVLARIVETVRTPPVPEARTASTDDHHHHHAAGPAAEVTDPSSVVSMLVTKVTESQYSVARERCASAAAERATPIASPEYPSGHERDGDHTIGGLSHQEHSDMTQRIRRTALQALHALLLSLRNSPQNAAATTAKKKKSKKAASSSCKDDSNNPNTYRAAAAQEFIHSLQQSDCEAVNTLVACWDQLLQSVTLVAAAEAKAAHEEDDVEHGSPLSHYHHHHHGGSTPPVLATASANHSNPSSGNDDGASSTGIECDSSTVQETPQLPEGGAATALLLDSARNVCPITAEDRMIMAGKGIPATTATDKRAPHPLQPAPTNRAEELKEARDRGVVTTCEEAEMSLILRIFIELLALAAEFEPNLKPTSTLCQQAIPVLVVRTIARCALGDANTTLCADMLWALLEAAPATTAHAILQDDGSNLRKHRKRNSNESVENTLPEPSATENIFQAILNQVSASHRKHQRELRNDLVIFISAVLREDMQQMRELKRNSAATPVEPIPKYTVDAVNAIVLVLFNMVCAPELNTLIEGLNLASNNPSSSYMQGNHTNSASNNNTRSSQVFLEDWAAITNGQGAAASRQRQWTRRFHGVASPSIRADDLQLKRLGWQILAVFYEWQGLRLCGTPFGPGTAVSCYEGLYLVDLCRMGFVDALLQYVDTRCDDPTVVSWTREELMTLQVESWELLTTLVQAAEDLRQYDVRPSTDDQVVHFLPTRRAQTNTPKCISSTNSRRSSRFSAYTTPSTGGGVEPAWGSARCPSAEDTTVLDQLCAADMQFVAAGGVGCALRYMEEAPNSVDGLKRTSLVMLSALSRSSHPDVQHSLLITPGLAQTLTLLLDSAQESVATANATLLASKRFFSISKNIVSTHPVLEGGDVFLSDTALDLVLSCLDFLKNIGDTSIAWALQAGRRKDANASEDTARNSPQRRTSRARSSVDGDGTADVLDFTGLEDIPRCFAESGGMCSLVNWMRLAVAPQNTHAKQLAGKLALTASTTAGRSMKALASPIVAMPSAPLLESFLHHHLSLMYALLHNVRALVLAYDNGADDEHGTHGQSDSFVAADGMHALVELVEAMAIAADVLPSPATNGGPLKGMCQDPTVIIRDVTAVLEEAKGEAGLIQEYRRGFQDVLDYALSILADLLYISSDARQQFVMWSSRRLERGLLQPGTTLSSVMPPHDGPHGSFINGVQLLVALWASGFNMRKAAMEEEEEGDNDTSRSFGAAEAGLSVLALSLKADMEQSLRREYIRRLLRRKYLPAYTSAKPQVSMTVGSTSFAPVVDEEFLLMCHTFSEYGNGVVKHYTGDERAAALLSTMNLLFSTDEDSARRRGLLTAQFIQESMGISIKVYSCLSALGFEALMRPEEATQKGYTLGSRGGLDKPSMCSVLALSPAERAHITTMAAVPALCSDELCLGMSTCMRLNQRAMPWTNPISVQDVLENAGIEPEAQRPINGDAEGVVHMRPTTPDRRRFASLEKDIIARSRELRQLIELSQNAEETQQLQLLERYLATRLRFQPNGISYLEMNTAYIQSEAARAAASSLQAEAEAGDEETSRAPGDSCNGSFSTKKLSVKTDNKALSMVPPADLARGLVTRLERQQRQGAADTLKGLVGGTYTTGVPMDFVEEGGSHDNEIVSTPSASAGSPLGDEHMLGSPGSGLFVASSDSLPLSAHVLAETTRATSSKQNRDQRTFALTAPVPRVPALGMPRIPLHVPRSHHLTLAERRQKKMQMIRSSLKELPPTTAPSVQLHPPQSLQILLEDPADAKPADLFSSGPSTERGHGSEDRGDLDGQEEEQHQEKKQRVGTAAPRSLDSNGSSRSVSTAPGEDHDPSKKAQRHMPWRHDMDGERVVDLDDADCSSTDNMVVVDLGSI